MPSRAFSSPGARQSGPPAIPEFAAVRLTRDLEYRGVSFPKGTPGVVVHKHTDEAYEVEFERPSFSVVTVTTSDIAAG
ncbi:DUF4926 domain-containing protein [uncultured Rhodospira sp.]|uniref:DUF4926 domain-containing protein n=1 Tax=uncultured Rhodospira sp. TaxID=1936189 RepID=UPI00260E873F|nr:DUF4926 domain-containing protein [uncultured Rhodospira sp.]